MFGPQSPNWLLITGPRLTAGSQSLSSEARCETQMSFPPCPPGLFEQKYRLSASGESVGPCSLKAVLTASPRRTGSDQSSWANFIIEIIETSALAVGGARTDDEWSAPHPTSSNSVDSGDAANCRMRLMRTSGCRLFATPPLTCHGPIGSSTEVRVTTKLGPIAPLGGTPGSGISIRPIADHPRTAFVTIQL